MKKPTVKMISEEFVAPVLAGTKLVTIRPERHRPHQIGDVLDLRVWTGKAYRSRQRHVCFVEVIDYAQILLRTEGFELDRVFTPRPADLAKLAVEDGFADWNAMIEWFARRYVLPFSGFMTRWRPLPKEAGHV